MEPPTGLVKRERRRKGSEKGDYVNSERFMVTMLKNGNPNSLSDGHDLKGTMNTLGGVQPCSIGSPFNRLPWVDRPLPDAAAGLSTP